MKLYNKMACVFLASGCATAAWAMPNDPDTTPGGAGFCQQYASGVAAFVLDAVRRKGSCVDASKGVHSDYNAHYSWCMRTPRREVEGAGAHIRDLTTRCLAAGAPRPPSSPPPAPVAQPRNGQTTGYKSKVGRWEISPRGDNGVNRCVADFTAPAPAGKLRFGWYGGSKYYMSWPGPNVPASMTTVTLMLDNYNGQHKAERAGRSEIKLDGRLIDLIFNTRQNITVIMDGQTQSWPLYGQNMTDVFSAMEDCTKTYKPNG